MLFPIQSTQAFFLAQSGVEFAVRYAKDQGLTRPAQLLGLNALAVYQRNLGAGRFTINYTNTTDTLTSSGEVPTATQRRQIVISNFTSFLYYFAYHKSITVQTGQVTGTLTNFPMLVSVTDGSLATTATPGGHIASWNAGTNDPQDLIFEALDDATCGGPGTSPCRLDHEIEYYAPTTGTLVAWVRVPSITDSRVIYMYYGNSCMTASTQNVTGVWNSDYRGVWHLSQNPTGTAPQMKDSTTNAYNGAAVGSFVAGDQRTAVIDGGLNFNGTNDEIQIAKAALGTTSVTVSAWFNATSFTETTFGGTNNSLGAVVFSTRDVDTDRSPTLVVSPAINNGQFGASDYLIFCDDTASVAVGARAISTTSIQTGTWYYAVGTFSRNTGTATYFGNWYVYLNGTQYGPNNFNYAFAGNVNNVNFSGASWRLANNPQWTGYSNIILDEVRVSNIERSAGWISTEYRNQSNPGNLGAPGFYAVGAEQNN
ncbi:MAG: DUF2341 domain-containing protein [Thermodesulfobacteriota bacterium]